VTQVSWFIWAATSGKLHEDAAFRLGVVISCGALIGALRFYGSTLMLVLLSPRRINAVLLTTVSVVVLAFTQAHAQQAAPTAPSNSSASPAESVPSTPATPSAQSNAGRLPPIEINPSRARASRKRAARHDRSARQAATRSRAPAPIVAAPPARVAGVGSAQEGYRSESATGGGPVLGTARLQDTPYAVSVVSKDLIQNTGARTSDDVFRLSPLTQISTTTGRNTQTFVNIRGFNVTNKYVDGLRESSYLIDPIEDKERVEIFSGLSGFLYGQADPGGVINYVLKRPTATPFATITSGNNSIGSHTAGNGYAHADLGGPIDADGKFGYRLNLLYQDGDTNIQHQSQKRALASAAVDWHVTDKILLQFDYSHSYNKLNGVPAAFVFPAGGFPANYVPANDRLWSQPWLYTSNETDKGGIRLTYDVSDWMTIRSAFTTYRTDSHFLTYQTQNIDAAGRFSPFASAYYPIYQDGLSQYHFADFKFETTPYVRHQLTVGYMGTEFSLYEKPNISQVCMSPLGTFGAVNCAPAAVSGFNIYDPLYVPMPSTFFDRTGGPFYRSTRQRNDSIVIGDKIDITDYFTVLAGVTRVTIDAQNFNATGATTGAYNKFAWTPSYAVMFKPTSWVTFYGNYIEGLEQGQVVPVGYTNTGATLEPLQSKQVEGGVKVTVNQNLLLTAAYFDIQKPLQYSNLAAPVPTFVQDGRVSSKGVEITATGKVTRDLTIVGGITHMKNTTEISNNPLAIGKRPQGIASTIGKAYVEYALPIPGLYISGGVNYIGNFATNVVNTQFLPSVTTFDIGGRYETTAFSRPITYRLYATNITNKSYWISPGALGEPLRVAFSGTVKF
jgi:iron complex outermembrane receptor protein